MEMEFFRKVEASEMKKILIVDDYADSCKTLCELLGFEFNCKYTCDSSEAIRLIQEWRPDIVLLDYKMPGVLGVEVCKRMREDAQLKNIPVIFMSGIAGADERISAFENGADDFITKPFHVKELILRIRARLDKKQDVVSVIEAENLKMDLIARQVFVDNIEVDLTLKQFEILKLLVENRNQLVTRERCLKDIWGGTEVTTRNVDSQINYLKRKIQNFKGKITAVPGLGYRLE